MKELPKIKLDDITHRNLDEFRMRNQISWSAMFGLLEQVIVKSKAKTVIDVHESIKVDSDE